MFGFITNCVLILLFIYYVSVIGQAAGFWKLTLRDDFNLGKGYIPFYYWIYNKKK